MTEDDAKPPQPTNAGVGRQATLDVICCSLEPWDEVWRRNQFLASEMLQLRRNLRLLFVELAVDVTWSVLHRQRPRSSRLRPVGGTGRLWAMAPRKWLPRRVWPGVDRSLGRQVTAAARRLGFERPLLWVNDSTYAQLVKETGWPSVYDVTDDWLLASHSPTEAHRQEEHDGLMLERAAAVVVCSPALATSRGQRRAVHLIPNGVDLAHFRAPMPRPADLPSGSVVVYQGTLNDGRLDIDLCVDIAEALAGRATLVLIGPSSLSPLSDQRLRRAGALLIGARPYADLPAYLQHADALVVPHEVNPFTESLDPIKAREFVAVGRPTVSTPVAGFRELGAPVIVARRDDFVEALRGVLAAPLPPGPGPLLHPPPTWTERAEAFLAVVEAAVSEA